MKQPGSQHPFTVAVLLVLCALQLASCAGREPTFSPAAPEQAERKYRAADVQRALDQLSSPDQSTRQHAAFVLAEMGPEAPAAVHKLGELVQRDPSMSVRGQAAQALGRIGPAAEEAVPALIAFLQDLRCGYERAYAPTALGEIGARADLAVPVLIQALQQDPEPVVQRLAAMALGDFHAAAAPAIPALVDAVRYGDKDLRHAAIRGIREIPARPDDVAVLLPLLSDEIGEVRRAAARSIGGAGGTAEMAIPR